MYEVGERVRTATRRMKFPTRWMSTCTKRLEMEAAGPMGDIERLITTRGMCVSINTETERELDVDPQILNSKTYSQFGQTAGPPCAVNSCTSQSSSDCSTKLSRGM